MAMTPEPLPGIHAVDFRAPPPSPVAPGRRSSFANDDILTEYLQQSLKVPDLVLPDRVFPRQKSVQNPPRIDFQELESLENEAGLEISELIARVGCLEVINHGISPDLMKLVLLLARGIFEIPPEKKKAAVRSPERRYGFEEIHGEEEIRDQSEEFLWCGEEAMRLEMEGVWPLGFSNFSREMEKLSGQIDEVGRKVLQFLQQHSLRKFSLENGLAEEQEAAGKVCYIQKHRRKTDGGEQSENSLRYDVIRMLIRGSEFPHALSLHVWSGATDFHVYSKKGWVSFCPAEDSIVITVGDRLQGWSGGQYKHVIGRPVFKCESEKSISMAFLYSPSKITNSSKDDKAVTISLAQQIIFAVLVTLIYQFLLYIYHIFV